MISPIRMGTFDLIKDKERIKCPICHEKIIPITCGFTKCSYSWSGVYRD